LVGRRRLRSGRTSWEEREAKQAESDFDFCEGKKVLPFAS